MFLNINLLASLTQIFSTCFYKHAPLFLKHFPSPMLSLFNGDIFLSKEAMRADERKFCKSLSHRRDTTFSSLS